MELSAAKFRSLLASLKSDQPASDQARRQPRVGLRGMISVVLLTPVAPPCKPMLVRLVNVSIGGVNFLFPEALPDAQLIEVRLPKVGGFDTIGAVVRHCRRASDGLFSIGAQFGRPTAQPVTQPVAKAS